MCAFFWKVSRFFGILYMENNLQHVQLTRLSKPRRKRKTNIRKKKISHHLMTGSLFFFAWLLCAFIVILRKGGWWATRSHACHDMNRVRRLDHDWCDINESFTAPNSKQEGDTEIWQTKMMKEECIFSHTRYKYMYLF